MGTGHSLTEVTGAFCRDCLAGAAESAARCPACGSPRLIRHPALHRLSIAHIDCDAFYATIEKRDDPSLADRPVIVGGGKRGVVSTACYVARTYGVRSAMPMFQALQRCPDAVVIRPNMAKYVAVARQVREAMRSLTPLVEPLSIDEAFLDLSGTERLHGRSAAVTLADFARRVARDIGITVSIGLSGNKFLAKIASDLDKPRGFAVLAPEEAMAFLRDKPIQFIFGIGKASAARLEKAGIRRVGDVQAISETDWLKRFGGEQASLWRLARGLDARRVDPGHDAKSVSSETTFFDDITALPELERHLWGLSEKVSARMKAARLEGLTITLKLKTARFQTVTRSSSLAMPTQLAGRIFETARELLAREANGTAYRLIGVGASHLSEAGETATAGLLDARAARAETAIDRLREKFGRDAVVAGRAFQPKGGA